MSNIQTEFLRLAGKHHFTVKSLSEATTIIKNELPDLKDELLAMVLLLKVRAGEDISDQPQDIQNVIEEAAAVLIERDDPSLTDAKIRKNGGQKVLDVHAPSNPPDGLHCET